MARLHPALAARLHLLEGMTSIEAALADPLMRERLDAFFIGPEPYLPPAAAVGEQAADGPHGAVPLRIYRPIDGAERGAPALVWVHGGGFRVGAPDDPSSDGIAREVAARAQAVVVSVDYRLAVGGVHHPVPLDDVVAAVRWTRSVADELGIGVDRISIGGDSAGANLAMAAVLRSRDEDAWLPRAVLMAYPTVHPVLPPLSADLADAVGSLPPMIRFLPEGVDEMHRNYLGGAVSGADGYAMPGIADLRGLPLVVVANAECDDLRASGEAFAASVALAGGDVRQTTARGMLHGFLAQPASLPEAERVRALFAAVVAGAA